MPPTRRDYLGDIIQRVRRQPLEPPNRYHERRLRYFTPKKPSILDGSLAQVEAAWAEGCVRTVLGRLSGLERGDARVATMLYTGAYRGNIENALRGRTVVVINSRLVDAARPATTAGVFFLRTRRRK
jgi:hypothetical protein